MIQDLSPQSPPRRIERSKPGRGTLAIGRVDGGPLASRTTFPSPFKTVMVAVVMGIAIAHSGLWAKARAQGVKAEKPGPAALDPAATRSRLVVRRPGVEKDARPMVILDRPSYPREIPEFGKDARLDILARELLRQAILIAARDELGLSTRDEVIGDERVEANGARPDGVEVISLIRDHKWRAQVRRVGGDRTEELFSGETPTATGEDLDSVRLIVAAEAWSRQAFPQLLKGLGLAGKPNDLKETTEPACPGTPRDDCRAWDTRKPWRRSATCTRRSGPRGRRRRPWVPWCAGMPSSAS